MPDSNDKASPLRHPCFFCKVKAGKHCVTNSGNKLPGYHRARKTAAGEPIPDAGGFQPGKSGNPGGRPTKDPALKASMSELTTNAVDTLKTIMDEKGAEARDRIRAAEIVLAYNWGKPAQPLDITRDKARKWSDEQLEDLVPEALERLAEEEAG